jgi:hypothetical protein
MNVSVMTQDKQWNESQVYWIGRTMQVKMKVKVKSHAE